MNTPARFLLLLLASGLTACHKNSPAQEDMDAEARQKAIEVRATADKEVAALKEAAAMREAARKEAAAKEALSPGSTIPASTLPASVSVPATVAAPPK